MAELKRHEELVVITKTYDLILWSCHHTGKFPRNHRFVLGAAHSLANWRNRGSLDMSKGVALRQ